MALLLAGTVLTAVACGASGSTLEKNQWLLKSLGEPDNLKSVLTDTAITATFDGGKGEVRGSSGCNTYFGAYEVNGDKLSVAEVAATERGCLSPPGVMEQEQEYLSLLAVAESFQADDTSLTIKCSDGRQLDFVKAGDR
jgi:heat shock protein HslJ